MAKKDKNKNKKNNRNSAFNNKKKKGGAKRFVLAAIIALCVGIICGIIGSAIANQPAETVTYNEFTDMVNKGEVEKIVFTAGDEKMYFYTKENPDRKIETDNPKKEGFKEEMLKANVEFEETSTPIWLTILGYIVPYIPFAILIFIFVKFLPGFSDRNFTVEAAEVPETTFDDVAGLDEIKKDMITIAETLKNPEICEKLGAHITRGVLLEGEPGNGKTLFARALAGETGVNFYSANASEFIEMYAGLGASRVRKLFKEAKEHAPSVVFIDELDAIGSKRDGSTDGAGREYTQCLNALLAAIDGFETSDGVMVIGATNRSEDLDPALVRPGRFDKQFVLPQPDCEAREKILRLHAKGKTFSDNVDFHELAKDTIGFSGAGLESLLNEAAMIALTNKEEAITRDNIEEASIRMQLKGHIKNSIGNRNLEEQKIVCYHEAGHTVANIVATDNDVRRVTVLPTTSGAGGLTMAVPPADRELPTIENLRARVKLLYAGRASEYILAGKQESGVSAGAAADIKEATGAVQTIAVLTEENGLLDYSEFGIAGQERMMKLCQKLSEELWQETIKLIEENWRKVDAIAKRLLDKDTLEQEEIMEIVNNA